MLVLHARGDSLLDCPEYVLGRGALRVVRAVLCVVRHVHSGARFVDLEQGYGVKEAPGGLCGLVARLFSKFSPLRGPENARYARPAMRGALRARACYAPPGRREAAYLWSDPTYETQLPSTPPRSATRDSQSLLGKRVGVEMVWYCGVPA